jgi:hypothetical protein
LIIVLLAITSLASAQVSPNIPIGDPFYDVIERLADAGLAPGYMRGTRPFTIAYGVQLVRQAGQLAAQRGGPEPALLATARDLLARLLPHRVGPAALGGEGEIAVGRTDEVIEPAIFSYGDRVGYLLPRAGAGAAPAEGLGLALTGRASVSQYAAAEVAGRVLLPGAGPQAGLLRGYGKLGLGALELEVGRDDVVWGYARGTALTLSGNARGLDQVALRTARPIVLPWLFRYLGPVQGAIFLARVDQQLPFAHPYLIGKRISILPKPWLELGVVHLFAFGGEGAPAYGASNFIEEFIFGYRRHAYSENLSNSAFSWDVRIRIPKVFELYWEHYFEDCCATIFTRDSSILAGVRRPAVLSARDDLALEFVATTFITYVHFSAPEFEQQGRIFGYSGGNSAQGAWAFWRYVGDRGEVVKLRLGFQRRGLPDHTVVPGGEPEWRIQGQAECRLPLRPGRAGRVDARARLILERVLTAGFTPGLDRTAGLGEIGLEASF